MQHSETCYNVFSNRCDFKTTRRIIHKTQYDLYLCYRRPTAEFIPNKASSTAKIRFLRYPTTESIALYF